MAMTKERLLIPRYLCTGTPGKPLWPGYKFNHGDIIRLVSKEWIESVANEAPHLFRPLQWWEARELEDMPEYVRIKNKVLRVVKYNLTFGQFLPEKEKYMKRLEYTQPATEQEYNDYQKQKEA